MYDVFYCVCVLRWCVKDMVTVWEMQGKGSFKKTNQPNN